MPETDDTSFKRASLREHPKLRWRRIVSNWPFLAWLGIIILAAYLYTRSTQFGQLTGVVETIAEPIAPLQTARLRAIKVELGDRVKAGQIVAVMDTTLVDVQLALAEATMAEAQGTLATYEGTMHNLVRTFDTAIKDAETKLGEQKSLEESDRARLKELQNQQAGLEDLFKKKLISKAEVDALKPEIVALERTVAAYPELIATYERMLTDSRIERENLQRSLRVADGEDVSKAISLKAAAQGDIMKTAVEMRKIEKESFNLRVSRDGIVSQLLQVPGDVVQSGMPIARIVSEHSDEIVGFLPELHLSSLKVGDTAYAFREYGRSSAIKLSVESIAPEVDTLPGRVSPIQGQPMRGRRIMFKIEGTHDLVPGETVQIRAISPFWAGIRSWFER